MTMPSEILAFWRDAGPKAWFAKNDGFDDACRRFEPAHHAAARGEYSDWAMTAEGALALVLLLDQFPRNLYRGSAHAFATDPLARQMASKAIAAGHDQVFAPELRTFFYLPFEHSEDLADQRRALALYDAMGDAELTKWAKLHADIIQRFGRFPHRNACLGRDSTPDEIAYLAEGGFQG